MTDYDGMPQPMPRPASTLVHFAVAPGAAPPHPVQAGVNHATTPDWVEVTCESCRLVWVAGQTDGAVMRVEQHADGTATQQTTYPKAGPVRDVPVIDLPEHERLAIVVGATLGNALADRDQARRMAEALEQDAAEARRHLAALSAILDAMGGLSFAADTDTHEAAKAFLETEAVGSTETDETPKVDG